MHLFGNKDVANMTTSPNYLSFRRLKMLYYYKKCFLCRENHLLYYNEDSFYFQPPVKIGKIQIERIKKAAR